MNKKLLAVAIAAGLAAPMFAQAGDVKVYGRVQAEYNNEGRDSGDPGQGVDDEAGMSRFGVKATEDLGNGLTATAVLEWRVDPADNAHTGAAGAATTTNTSGANGAPYGSLNESLGQRQMWVGIKSKQWGQIAAGSFGGVYKESGGVKYDPFVATHLQARRAGGMSGGAGYGGHNGFVRNAIQYTSPKINGFQARFQISPDETNKTAGNQTNADNDWALGLSYTNGPLEVVFAHSVNKNTDQAQTTTTDDQKMTKIGAKYKFGNHQIAGQYEWIKDACTGSGAVGARSNSGDSCFNQGSAPGGTAYNRITAGDDGNVWFLGYQFKQGNNIWVAQVGQNDDDTASNLDTDYFAVGIIHKFSKTTRIFGGYTQSDSDVTSADRDAWTVGIRKDF